jgi:hypothetical protein
MPEPRQRWTVVAMLGAVLVLAVVAYALTR